MHIQKIQAGRDRSKIDRRRVFVRMPLLPARFVYCGVLTAAVLFLYNCAGIEPSRKTWDEIPKACDQAQTDQYWENVKNLQEQLAALDERTDKTEAWLISETSIHYSLILSNEYRLVRPALLHNMLVKFGLRDRGLCYHWTTDLMTCLKELDLKSYRLHWGVAYRGSNLREHNSVVVTARDQDFEKGIILDPWRYSGDLYWALVKKDKYPWRELPPEEW
jgi:hypothetical protein